MWDVPMKSFPILYTCTEEMGDSAFCCSRMNQMSTSISMRCGLRADVHYPCMHQVTRWMWFCRRSIFSLWNTFVVVFSSSVSIEALSSYKSLACLETLKGMPQRWQRQSCLVSSTICFEGHCRAAKVESSHARDNGGNMASRTGSKPSRRYTHHSQNMPRLTGWLLDRWSSWYLRFLFILPASSFPVSEWQWSIWIYVSMKRFFALAIVRRRWESQSMLSFWNEDFKNSLADICYAEVWAFSIHDHRPKTCLLTDKHTRKRLLTSRHVANVVIAW